MTIKSVVIITARFHFNICFVGNNIREDENVYSAKTLNKKVSLIGRNSCNFHL